MGAPLAALGRAGPSWPSTAALWGYSTRGLGAKVPSGGCRAAACCTLSLRLWSAPAGRGPGPHTRSLCSPSFCELPVSLSSPLVAKRGAREQQSASESRHRAQRILVLRASFRAGLAAGEGCVRLLPGLSSLSHGPGAAGTCLCVLLFEEAKARRRAGAEEPGAPHPAAPRPCPRPCPVLLLPVVSRVQGLGRGAGHVRFVPFPCRVPEPPLGGHLPASPARLGLAGTREPGARRPRLFVFVLPALCCGWGGRPPQP